MMAQHYDDPLARERMSRGCCPECGGEVVDHGGLGGAGCSLTDNGVASRIMQYRHEERAATCSACGIEFTEDNAVSQDRERCESCFANAMHDGRD